jgi:hypothetical protein
MPATSAISSQLEKQQTSKPSLQHFQRERIGETYGNWKHGPSFIVVNRDCYLNKIGEHNESSQLA